MTISAELQERYSTECDVDWCNAFILSHPTAGRRYLVDHPEEIVGLVDGFPCTFSPVPTQVTPPTMDSSGRQEMQITWCGILGEAQSYLEGASADPSTHVSCRYTVFILGDQHPKIDPPIEFYLVSASVTENAVSVTASRVDILNKPFPGEVYRPDKFPGLVL